MIGGRRATVPPLFMFGLILGGGGGLENIENPKEKDGFRSSGAPQY